MGEFSTPFFWAPFFLFFLIPQILTSNTSTRLRFYYIITKIHPPFQNPGSAPELHLSCYKSSKLSLNLPLTLFQTIWPNSDSIILKTCKQRQSPWISPCWKTKLRNKSYCNTISVILIILALKLIFLVAVLTNHSGSSRRRHHSSLQVAGCQKPLPSIGIFFWSAPGSTKPRRKKKPN